MFVVSDERKRSRVVIVTAVDLDQCEVRAGSETFTADQILGWAL